MGRLKLVKPLYICNDFSKCDSTCATVTLAQLRRNKPLHDRQDLCFDKSERKVMRSNPLVSIFQGVCVRCCCCAAWLHPFGPASWRVRSICLVLHAAVLCPHASLPLWFGLGGRCRALTWTPPACRVPPTWLLSKSLPTWLLMAPGW
jgi:hypothetical protein